MKKIFSFVLTGAIALTAGVFAACDGGGGSTSSNVPSDGVFGTLPGLADTYMTKGVEMMQEMSSIKDEAGKQEFVNKVKAMEQESEEAFAAELAKLKEQEIPTEVGDDVLFKLEIPFTLDEETKFKQGFGIVRLVAVVETTEELFSGRNPMGFSTQSVAVVALDADGQPLTVIDKPLAYDAKDEGVIFRAPGSKAYARMKLEMEPWTVEKLARTKKLCLVTDKSELFEQAKAADKEDKQAFEQKTEEMMKGLMNE